MRLIHIFHFVFLACFVELAQAQQVPDGFIVEKVTDEVEQAVGCTFSQDGVLFIWTKKGQVFLFRDGELQQTPLLDISEEVAQNGDMGMLGFALHPFFEQNGYFYVSYVVDRHHLLTFGTPEYDPEKSIEDRATIGRITRYQADVNFGYTKLVPGSRKVLLGKDKKAQLIFLHNSHSVGALQFGEDGSLLAGMGDGTTYEGIYTGGGPPYYNADVPTALADGMLTPKDDVGSFRAQMMQWLNGKILRLDPETGAGLPDNPFFDFKDPYSAQSRIYALGIRNPYRFTVRPGTGSAGPENPFPGVLYIGDVSYYNREELNIVTYPGANLGWPLYEGESEAYEYFNKKTVHPYVENPLGGKDGCPTHLAFENLLLNRDPRLHELRNPCDSSLKLPPSVPTFTHKLPDLFWKHIYTGPAAYFTAYDAKGFPVRKALPDSAGVVLGDSFLGEASLGGTFYQGGTFPEEYRDNFYLLDYMGWIRRIEVDLNDTIQRIEPFLENEGRIVHLSSSPDGCLYYVEYPGGVNRICFGQNVKPNAEFEVNAAYGPSPHTVRFRNKSNDPNRDELSYSWDFGDGSFSDEKDPVHVFETVGNSPASFFATLTVRDSEGLSDTDSMLISLNNTPPRVKITSIRDGERYADPNGSLLELEQQVEDLESSRDELTYHWVSYLHHNFHFHLDRELKTPSGALFISSVGCDETVPAVYYYRLQLTVTDPQGLAGTDTVYLFPECDAEIRFTQLSFEDEERPALHWTLVASDSIDRFSVQLASGQGGFRELGRLESIGRPFPFPESFTFEVPSLSAKASYRIKYYTTKGAFGYSPVINSSPERRRLLLLGNPVMETLRFSLNNYIGPARAIIFDIQGRIVLREEYEISPSGNNELPVRNLATGTYLLQVETEVGSFQARFVKGPKG